MRPRTRLITSIYCVLSIGFSLCNSHELFPFAAARKLSSLQCRSIPVALFIKCCEFVLRRRGNELSICSMLMKTHFGISVLLRVICGLSCIHGFGLVYVSNNCWNRPRILRSCRALNVMTWALHSYVSRSEVSSAYTWSDCANDAKSYCQVSLTVPSISLLTERAHAVNLYGDFSYNQYCAFERVSRSCRLHLFFILSCYDESSGQ